MYKIISNPSNHTSSSETFYRPAPRPAIASLIQKKEHYCTPLQTKVHVTQKSLNRLSDWLKYIL